MIILNLLLKYLYDKCKFTLNFALADILYEVNLFKNFSIW